MPSAQEQLRVYLALVGLLVAAALMALQVPSGSKSPRPIGRSGSFTNVDESILQENAELRRRVQEAESRIEALHHNLTETRDQSQRVGEELERMDRQEDLAADATVDATRALTIVVLGASGDLAKKKTYPALWGLYREGLLPQHAKIVGYARSKLAPAEFHKLITSTIKVGENETLKEKLKAFTAMCSYVACTAYESDESMAQLSSYCTQELEQGRSGANRLFYLALPPSVFIEVGTAIKKAGFSKTGWNRIIVEKPFGRDFNSSQELTNALGKLFTERQQYRIDHYLGKEMSQNLMVLRFANSFFEPLWNRHYINNVKITFKENIGTEGRGGYFDSFGIIRDVMQNHLMQLFALVAMEPPVSLNSEDVRDEKVKVLRSTEAIGLEDIIVGQYSRSLDGKKEGYLDDAGVPKDSITPTFAQAILRINNPRWQGVPFIVKCGKALEERKAEIRVQFKRYPHSIFPNAHPNELVIRIQPNEAIYMNVMNKVPGLTSELTNSDLDLSYKSKFQVAYTPEAYERLILDAIRGDQNLFVRVDELAAAWRIFTPVLHSLDQQHIQPLIYPFGSRGPPEADEQAAREGWIDTHVKNPVSPGQASKL